MTGSNVPLRPLDTVISTGRVIGQHRLRPGAVTRVSAAPAGRVMFLVAEVLVRLPIASRFKHRRGELPQQPVRAGQLIATARSAFTS